MNYQVLELAEENEKQYLKQVVDLEERVLKDMEKRGQVGQFFTTGTEGILEYIHQEQNTVMVAVDENDKVIAATYLTQGQEPFTYNDITKYFKYGKKYQDWVKSMYKSEYDYKKDMLSTYVIKRKAFQYAKAKLLEEFPQYKGNLMEFLQHEIDEEHNHFHEKSQLRNLLNKFMSEYIEERSKDIPGLEQRYDMFYWTTLDDVAMALGKEDKKDLKRTEEMDFLFKEESIDYEYGQILKKGPLEIYEKPEEDNAKEYYTANTKNALELDTYITDPNNRSAGISRALVLEGLKKCMEKYFTETDQKDLFLCSTSHRENLSSKYISDFYGLNDLAYVKRRDGIPREVHIGRVSRENYKKFLNTKQKEMSVLYGYNPQNLEISATEKLEILQRQLKNEDNEYIRIKKARTENGKRYTGAIDYENRKLDKKNELKRRIEEVQSEINAEQGQEH